MKQYQSAFEQYFSENNTYATCATMEGGFVGGAPADPKTGTTTPYTCTTTATPITGYCVCATLDFSTTGNASAGNAGACTFAAGSSMFCVQNLQ